MKKIFLSLVVIAAIATSISSCKKEEKTSDNNNTPSATSIVGTWGSDKIETYLVSNDQKVGDTTITEFIVASFTAAGGYSISIMGQLSETGTYNLLDKNNKKYLVTQPVDEEADTVLIENITATGFNINEKEWAVRSNEETYDKIYFIKK